MSEVVNENSISVFNYWDDFSFSKGNRIFVLDVIGDHVGVQVVPMTIILQEKILFTYFGVILLRQSQISN